MREHQVYWLFTYKLSVYKLCINFIVNNRINQWCGPTKTVTWKQRVVAGFWESLISMCLMKMFKTHTLCHSDNFLRMTVSVLCWWWLDGWMVNGQWSSTSLSVANIIIWIKTLWWLHHKCTFPSNLTNIRKAARKGWVADVFFKIINSICEVICTYQERKCLEFRLLIKVFELLTGMLLYLDLPLCLPTTQTHVMSTLPGISWAL